MTDVFAGQFGEPPDEVLHEQWNIFRSLAQRRNGDRNDVQPKLLPGIQTPVRIVAGADDQVVPRSNAEFLQERLPNAQVDLIAGAGHFCWEEKPAEYAALLTNWWVRAKAASKS